MGKKTLTQVKTQTIQHLNGGIY